MQVVPRGVITIKVELEAIIYVYQKNLNGRTIQRATQLPAYCTVSSIAHIMPTTSSSLPSTTPAATSSTGSQLRVPSAMCLVDLPQWWSQPVSAVQPDGLSSTEDILWHRIRSMTTEEGLVIPPAMFVWTMLLKWDSAELHRLSRVLFSSEFSVEVCLARSSATAGRSPASCVPNNGQACLTWKHLDLGLLCNSNFYYIHIVVYFKKLLCY